MGDPRAKGDHPVNARRLTSTAIKRNLRAMRKKIDDMVEYLRGLESHLVIPSAVEHRQMKSGAIPLTPDALLIGTLRATQLALRGANMIISDYSSYTPSDLLAYKLTLRHSLDRSVMEGLIEAIDDASRRAGRPDEDNMDE